MTASLCLPGDKRLTPDQRDIQPFAAPPDPAIGSQHIGGKRMRSIAGLALVALVAAATAAQAQDSYPSQTVRLVVPAAAGSTTDTLARLVADQLARKWGKPVVVENIAGGGMNTGSAQVARSAPDGHAMLVAPPAPFTISHLLSKDL